MTRENKASRAEVYAAIDSERAYQDQGRGNAQRVGEFEGVALTPGELIVTMEHILLQARTAWYAPNGPELAAGFIRKLAGCAVQYGERYGMPARDGHSTFKVEVVPTKEKKPNAKPEAKS